MAVGFSFNNLNPRRNMETLQPLHSYILVKPVKDDSTTKSGIVLLSQPPQAKGTAIAIGAEAKEVKVGQIVFYPIAGYKSINLDRVKHILIKEEELLGVATE